MFSLEQCTLVALRTAEVLKIPQCTNLQLHSSAAALLTIDAEKLYSAPSRSTSECVVEAAI
jgi:hypothetical protein